MRRTLTFLRLFSKRLLKKPSFVLILLVMPILVLGLKYVLDNDNDNLHIALYCEEDNEAVKNTIKELTKDDGAITFYKVKDLKELKRDVLTNYADSGFVFREGLYERLITEQADNCISMYESTKTMMSDIAKERIYSALYKHYYFDIMKKTLTDKGYFEMKGSPSEEEAYAFLEKQYQVYAKEGGVFEIIYNDEENNRTVDEVRDDKSWLLRSVKGILAVFVMIAAFAGAIFRAIDEKNGVYKTLGYAEKPWVNLTVVFLPTLIAGIVAYISLWISGVEDNMALEALKMVIYIVLLTTTVGFIRSVIDNEVVLCAILPMITIVCVICINIFVNVATYVPGVRVLRYFLTPNYYLNYMHSVKGYIITFSVLIVSGFLSVIVDKRRNR